MTVKELREKLSEYPDDMKVVFLDDYHEERYYIVSHVKTNELIPAPGLSADEFEQAYQGDDSDQYVTLS